LTSLESINVVADFLSRLTIPTKGGMIDDHFPDEHLFAISTQTPWFVDIANYLTTGRFPQHFSYQERCKIVRKSTTYTWVAGYLFKLGPDQVLRICIREDEVHDILHAFHDEPCGGHYATKRTTYKILQAGYYWPTLHRDAQQYTFTVMNVKGWGSLPREMKFPCSPRYHWNHLTSGVWTL
jgi:hypothetical protein